MIETEHVAWISEAPMDSTRVKGFTNDLSIADRNRAVDAMRRNAAGEALPPERFPKEFYVKRPGEKIGKLPDLANAGGFWTVSVAVADVLRTVDLGRSSLYPTKAFRYDRKTPLEGEYYCLNFGERKTAFLPSSHRGQGNRIRTRTSGSSPSHRRMVTSPWIKQLSPGPTFGSTHG